MKSTLTQLARTPATIVWLVLISATVLSWRLGTEGRNASHTSAGIVILLIAFAKIRFVGLYFMELRNAPLPLRALFEAYCLVAGSVVVGMFVWA